MGSLGNRNTSTFEAYYFCKKMGMLGNGIRYKQKTDLQQPNFKPRLWLFLQNTPITFILIALNFSIFLAMCGSGINIMEPTNTDILTWGGNLRSYTLGGDWWRLITSMFVHYGLVHFALNIFTLFQLGIFLEKFVGRWAYLFSYFSTGIIASLIGIWWSGENITAGATGAVFGLFGIFVVLLANNSIEKAKRQKLFAIIGLFIIINLGFSLYKKIDNPVIVGGFVSGIAFGCLLYWFISLKQNKLLFSGIIFSVSIIVSAAYLHLHRDDTKAFQQAIGLISEQEQKALTAQKKLKTLSVSQGLAQVDTVMLPAWQKSKLIIAQANQLHLNGRQQKVRQELNDYLDLQLKQSNLIGQYFKGDSLLVKQQLPVIKQQIDSILKKMNETLSH